MLVYNGELYNDQDLRTELEAAGHSFRSSCDTEVVMAAYLQWGRSCIERFRGMFAFGLQDYRDGTLWLARDRFGVKPLFYTQIGNQFVFASSLAAILAHPAFSKRPAMSAVHHYLMTTRLSLGRQTMYEGVHTLCPAEQMLYQDGKFDVTKYWDYCTNRLNVSYEEATELLQDHLTQAVQLRLSSDVPVGMFLSGGVDSSTIASIASRTDHARMFSVCGSINSGDTTKDDQPRTELEYARRCAKRLQFDLQPVCLSSGDYLDRWLQLVQELRTPMSTPSDVVIYEIAKAAKRNVGVVLGGEGSDELLCGYGVQHWSGHDYDAVRPDRPSPSNALLASICKQYGRNTFANEADHYFALNSLLPMQMKAYLLQPHIWQQGGHDREVFGFYQGIYDTLEGLPTVEKNVVLLHRLNLESLLSRLDSATMHASLEARVPFTDHILVEKMFSLPFSYRIDDVEPAAASAYASADLYHLGRLRPKRILRALARQLMPIDLASRKKASFPTGVATWLRGDWTQWIVDYLARSEFARFLLRGDFLTDFLKAPARAGMWLWPVLNLVLWGDAEFA